MKPGTRVNITGEGRGTIIDPIGKTPGHNQVLVRLDKPRGVYDQLYFSVKKLKEIKN